MDRIKKSLSLIVWSFLILSQKNFAAEGVFEWTMTTKQENEQIETASKIIENPWLVDSIALNQSIEQLKKIEEKLETTQLEEEKLETPQLEDVQSLIQQLNNIAKINNELLQNTAPTEHYGADIINLHENGTKIFTNIWQITSDVVEIIIKRIEAAINKSNDPKSKEKIANNKDAEEKLKILCKLVEELPVLTGKLKEYAVFYERLKKDFDQKNKHKDHPITIRLTSIYKHYDHMLNYMLNKLNNAKNDLENQHRDLNNQHKEEISNLTGKYEKRITKLIKYHKNEIDDKNKIEEDLYKQNQKETDKIKTLTVENLEKLEKNKKKIEKLKSKETKYLNQKKADSLTIFEKNEKIEKLTNIMIGGAIVGGIVCVVAGYKIGYKISALRNSPQLSQENRSLPDKKIIHTILPAAQQKKLQHVL